MIPYDISRKTTLKQKGGLWLTRRLGADVDYKQAKENFGSSGHVLKLDLW